MKTMSEDEVKKVQLDLLMELDTFCRENNIRYFLYAGTLIGAARHKGFIPWDDDIDVCMRREDYDYFFSNFNRVKNGNGQAISMENDPNYYTPAGKLIDKRTVLIEETNFRYPIGVYVDVFPMDRMPAENAALIRLDRKIDKYRKAIGLKTISVSNKRKWTKNAILRVGEFLLRPISMPYLLKKISSLAQMYNQDDSCTKLANISIFTYGMKEVHLISEFEDVAELEFEGSRFFAPCGYDSILRRTYGDYMKLPPKEKRVTHHAYQAYWKQAP